VEVLAPDRNACRLHDPANGAVDFPGPQTLWDGPVGLFAFQKRIKPTIKIPGMIKILIMIALLAALSVSTMAQPGTWQKVKAARLPLIASVDFQNFNLPLQDVKSHFTHPGVSLGTEINLHPGSKWIQQLHAAFARNKAMGNAVYLYTQTAFRYRIYRPWRSEVKLGAGWQRNFHPVDAYKFKNGEWIKVQGGKSLLIVPVGISVFYKRSETASLVPFLSYQLLPTFFYDDVLPLSFYDLFQAGARFHLKANKQN
jgi:hypothetical protein